MTWHLRGLVHADLDTFWTLCHSCASRLLRNNNLQQKSNTIVQQRLFFHFVHIL
jgi:hypothetical protein